MAYRVVCISRMTAAGGEPIGRLVADRLGFRYVDDEVIALAAERAGLERAVLEAEEYHKSLLARLMDALIAPPIEPKGFLVSGDGESYYGTPPAPTAAPTGGLRRFIESAIVEIAHRGRVVIVAHAASLALAKESDALRVLVLASKATRIDRLWAADKLVSEEEYAKAIAESDRERQQYLSRFYDIDQESPTLYDLVINTDRLTVAEAVAAVTTVART
jgi:hypothetical protein